MRNFRCILLCLSLLSAVGLMAGCSCGNPQDETSASTPAETSTVGYDEPITQETTMDNTTMDGTSMDDMTVDPGTSAGNVYETGNGTQGTDDGLMGDVTDGLEQIGDDISDAAEDVTDGMTDGMTEGTPNNAGARRR